MQSFNKILVAALVAATATGAGAEGALDLRHSGDDRYISTRVVDSDLRIVSHGDGGVIDAGIFGSADVTVYALGNETAARLHLSNVSGLTVMSGLCPRGMAPASLTATGGNDTLLILPCQ